MSFWTESVSLASILKKSTKPPTFHSHVSVGKKRKKKKILDKGAGRRGKNFSISYNTTLNFQSYLSTNYTNVCVLSSNYDKSKQGVPLK